jgi:hypothetical protein
MSLGRLRSLERNRQIPRISCVWSRTGSRSAAGSAGGAVDRLNDDRWVGEQRLSRWTSFSIAR